MGINKCKYKHKGYYDKEGKLQYVLGLDKDIADDEASLLGYGNSLNLPTEFWELYFTELNGTNKELIGSVLDKMVSNCSKQGNSFEVHNWDVVLDFLLYTQGKDMKDIARDMVPNVALKEMTKNLNKKNVDYHIEKEFIKEEKELVNKERTKLRNNIYKSRDESSSFNNGRRPVMKEVCAYYNISESLIYTGKGSLYYVDKNKIVDRDAKKINESFIKKYTLEHIRKSFDQNKSVKDMMAIGGVRLEDIEEIPVRIANRNYSISDDAIDYLLLFTREVVKQQNER